MSSMLSAHFATAARLAENRMCLVHSNLPQVRTNRKEGVLHAEFPLCASDLSSEGICYARASIAC